MFTSKEVDSHNSQAQRRWPFQVAGDAGHVQEVAAPLSWLADHNWDADALVFWAATEDLVRRDLQRRAEAQAKSLKQAVPDINIIYSKRTGVRNWAAVLPPSKHTRLRLYQRQWLQHLGYERSRLESLTEKPRIVLRLY